ncbi:hypothetical protein P3X46_034895 [Hevea brasiliensis]|uniref:Uncharacterized protein n=1 Tax=Hevea brasiliensis TaxID=3981 RepID=A0ABQ9K8S1_HEVBR|nr:hypothetical protein P3X46_034895 [Hevea brasiliensis]
MDPSYLLFTRSLSLRDLNGPLNFPNRSLRAFHFPQGVHSIVFEALDVHNQPFHFRLSKRRVGPHPKPVIYQALWRQYVMQKNLREHDRVSLSMEIYSVSGRFVRYYRVIAQRRMFRLFGKDIWVNVEQLQEPH